MSGHLNMENQRAQEPTPGQMGTNIQVISSRAYLTAMGHTPGPMEGYTPENGNTTRWMAMV